MELLFKLFKHKDLTLQLFFWLLKSLLIHDPTESLKTQESITKKLKSQ